MFTLNLNISFSLVYSYNRYSLKKRYINSLIELILTINKPMTFHNHIKIIDLFPGSSINFGDADCCMPFLLYHFIIPVKR